MTAAAAAAETGKRLAAADGCRLNATLHWSQELLDAEAARVDRMAAAGPLAAMPVALKDNIVTVEQPTTCGSRILEGYVSPYNATVVERLRAAGAMIAAKTNLDEFAMGSSTEHSAFGRVKHPWTRPGSRRAPRAAPPRSWPREWCRPPSDRRPAVRCASPRASAAS